MKINIDRLATLAGLPVNSSRKSLNEGKHVDAEMDEGPGCMDEAEDTTESYDMDESEMEEDEDMDEMVEIDEVMLVQELRRAKKMMLESKNRKRKQDLQEAQLKKIIEEEVQNIFGEMNLNAEWMYGNKKPRRSKKGYTAQGSYLKGIGFK